jgi:hypothetical protein
VYAWKSWLSWFGTVAASIGLELEELGLGDHLLPDDDLVDAAMSSSATGATTEADPFANHAVNWLDQLELLAVFARIVQRFGVNPLGEDTLNRVGVDLLGALQDSLILLAYGRAEDRDSCASSREIYELLRRGRADRTFASFDTVPGLVLPEIPVDPSIPPGPADHAVVLECLKRAHTTIDFYSGLQPEDGPPDGKLRGEAQIRIRADVLSMYPLAHLRQDTELPTPNPQQTLTIRTMLWRMRSVHRSIVVALSDNPDHRALAMSPEEMRDPGTAGQSYIRDHSGSSASTL